MPIPHPHREGWKVVPVTNGCDLPGCDAGGGGELQPTSHLGWRGTGTFTLTTA